MDDATAALLERLAGLEGRLAVLEADNERLRAENDQLRTENRVLVERVAVLEAAAGRDSNNSSKPPSQDGTAPRQKRAERRAEQRAAGKRKPGKQPGAPGASARRREPDLVVAHPPRACACCGSSLAGAPVVRTETRQVVEVPAVEAVVSDHVVEHRQCPCGTVTVGEFPPEATAPVCFGPGLSAFAVYLMAGQHLPLARTKELIADVWGLPVSEGWLTQVMARAADRLTGWIDHVKTMLRAEPVVHADETSVRVGVGLEWVHVVSTGLLTLLEVHPNRGRAAMADIGVLPGFAGTVVHDGWVAYEGIDISLHAQCGVHLLRYLRGLCLPIATNQPYQRWAAQLVQVLLEAAGHARSAAANDKTKVSRAKRRRIRTRWAQTLAVAYSTLPAGPPPRNDAGRTWTRAQRDAWNLIWRLDRHTDDVLRLLDDTAVPMDNNQAERDLRMVKIHDKISGCFRSPAGARTYLRIRSYLQTGAKHGHHRLDLLTRLFTTGPWTPPPRTT